jgi:homoserine O-acetyltransferase/O-succinyltransferase
LIGSDKKSNAGGYMKPFSRVSMVVCSLLVFSIAKSLQAADYPVPKEGSWIVRDFRFHTGETLPELRLHYTTIGSASGEAVLLLHGTDGSAANLLNPGFAGELFGPGQPLDATRYFLILPDALGAGNPPSHPTNFEQSSRATITTTWCAPNTDWSRSIWA